MDSLIGKHARSRYIRQDNNEERSSSTKIQPAKTQSLKETNKSQSWIRRQFSRKMSSDNDFSDTDYPAAVAAAAYSIQSLEQSKLKDKKEATYGPDKSFNKMKSKVEDTGIPHERLKSALKSPDETPKKSFKDPDNTSKKKPSFTRRISFAETDKTISSKPEEPAVERAPELALPSMKRPPTFADNPPFRNSNKNLETIMPKSDHPASRPFEIRKQSATKPGPGNEADAWEKKQMENIIKRYEKLRATIDNWETKMKDEANRKIAKLDKKKASAIEAHRVKITKIERTARGARKQAEKNKKTEELKVEEKARKIRITGKMPTTCLCF